MLLSSIRNILYFMQQNDINGFWLEWFQEIESEESSFDPDYVINTLQDWYLESKDEKYLLMCHKVASLKQN